MGALITFMKGVKKAFTNEKGKIQIFPKPDLSLAVLVALVFCWFYFDLNSQQQMLMASLTGGAIVIWSIRHAILQETPFISYFAWATLFGVFAISVYLIIQFGPIVTSFL